MWLYITTLTFLLEPDLLCDFLLELGACSASVVDADAGTDREEPLFSDINDPYQDTVNNWAIQPFWNQCTIMAQFPTTVMEGLESQILPLLRDHDAWEGLVVKRNGTIPSRDWVTHVQQNWKPIIVADTFLLQFPWHNETDLVELEQQHLRYVNSTSSSSMIAQPPLIRLRLRGGIAFGTGEHATTQLCLEWLSNKLRNTQSTASKTTPTPASAKLTAPLTILDYGTGSGILGIAACQLATALGIPVSATGVDIDADACRIANANAELNHIIMKNYLPPLDAAVDDESRSLLWRAHHHQINTTTGTLDEQLIWKLNKEEDQNQFDIVVANILAGPLIALAPVLANLCRGSIGMSGILPHQGPAVANAYQKAGFINVVVAKELNGWVLVTGDKE